MNLLVVTTLSFWAIRLTNASDQEENYFKRLNKAHPILFEYVADGEIKYIHAQEEFKKHKEYRLKDENCLIKRIDSILDKIDSLRENLSLVARFIREHTFYKSGKNLISFPEIQQDTQLSVRCTKSAFDCIKEVARKAKNYTNNETNLIEYRTTASYYLCWYTLNLNPLFSRLDELACLSNKFDEYYGSDRHMRYDFSCAKNSFCPDICCGKALRRARAADLPLKTYNDFVQECKKSNLNPCYQTEYGTCELSTTNNKNLAHLIENKLNVTCKCPTGKKYSNEYSVCVDLDECAELKHECRLPNQACLNTIGSYECVCKHGYRLLRNKCVPYEFFENDQITYVSSVHLDELERV